MALETLIQAANFRNKRHKAESISEKDMPDITLRVENPPFKENL